MSRNSEMTSDSSTNQRLALGINTWAMEGMARHDADITGEVFLKGGNLRRLAGRLTAHYRAQFGCWPEKHISNLAAVSWGRTGSAYMGHMPSQQHQYSWPPRCR